MTGPKANDGVDATSSRIAGGSKNGSPRGSTGFSRGCEEWAG